MNTIFLDFDGVMHPVSAISGLSPYHPTLDIEMQRRELFRWLPVLEDVLKNYEDVTLAVHSSWKQYLSNQQMHGILGSMASRYIGITPNGVGRYQGILTLAERAGIENYVILDDAIAEFPHNHPQLIATQPSTGLSDPMVVEQLRFWLKGL